jgi:putative membrane protein
MFDAIVASVTSGLPVLVSHFLAALLVYVIGLAVYVWLTPYRELHLVREGNTAAAITLGGAIVGLAIPLAAMLRGSTSVPDILVWGAIAAVLQAATFGTVLLLLREMPKRIAAGNVAAATVSAAAQVGVGILNAGAMSG